MCSVSLRWGSNKNQREIQFRNAGELHGGNLRRGLRARTSHPQKSALPKEEHLKTIASWAPEGSMQCLPERIGEGGE